MKNIPFTDAFKFPTSDKSWQNKFGVYALILVLATAIPKTINSIIGLSGQVALAIADKVDPTYMMSVLAASGMQMVLGLSVLPVSLYLAGYVYEVTKNIFEGKKDKWETHGDVWNRIVKGFRLAVLNSGPVIAFMILGTLVIITVVVFISLAQSAGVVTVIIGVVLAILLTLLFIALGILTPLISGALYFIYLKTGSIKKAYRWSNLVSVIKAMWKEIYILHFIKAGLMLIAGIVSLMTICLSFVTTPLLTAYVTFIMANLTGDIFSQFKEEIKVA